MILLQCSIVVSTSGYEFLCLDLILLCVTQCVTHPPVHSPIYAGQQMSTGDNLEKVNVAAKVTQWPCVWG